ncbi:MAG: hypothetical protein GTN74_03300 [Proteobacteria bacterium]|nr:hypothetical protein [Pseudomonadota bacterium]NIS68250.1 hypothetical protein [Pseudomonadota bacterium]
MECAEIEELLSEYIDGILGENRKALVEKHLSTCQSCREELASLKALVNELGSLDSVEAPRDFLEKLHERMEPRFGLGRLIHWLFVPVRIKVPLEFATVGAIALLIFYVSSMEERKSQIARAPEISTSVQSEEERALDTVKTTLEKEPEKAKRLFEQETVRQPDQERKTIELALILETGTPESVHPPSSVREAAPAPPEGARVAGENFVEVARPMEEKQVAAVAQDVEKKRDEPEQVGRATEGRAEESPISKNQAESSRVHADKALSKVKEIVSRVGGKVILVEYEAETDRPKSIHAEIPAKGYRSFVEYLEEIASLRTPPPILYKEDQESVLVRIRFVPLS